MDRDVLLTLVLLDQVTQRDRRAGWRLFWCLLLAPLAPALLWWGLLAGFAVERALATWPQWAPGWVQMALWWLRR